jgi:hypothetical protein
MTREDGVYMEPSQAAGAQGRCSPAVSAISMFTVADLPLSGISTQWVQRKDGHPPPLYRPENTAGKMVQDLRFNDLRISWTKRI